MEDKKIQPRTLTENDAGAVFTFEKQEELNCYKIVYQHLIKLLYLIEDEEKSHGRENAHNWFTTFMLDLKSSNSLCDFKLTKVIIKMNSLYERDAYKTMEHSQIKRQIMESRGIIEYLITELDREVTTNSDKK